MSIFENQEEFMLRGSQTVVGNNPKQVKSYKKMIDEEYSEFTCAYHDEPVENQVKECVDLIVVCLGFLFSLGVEPRTAWQLVWRNNMAKVTGDVVKNADGKIQKTPESIARKKQMMNDIKELLK